MAMFMAINRTVNVAEFKDRFSELLALVEEGGELIVCRRNAPLSRVGPIHKPAIRKPQRRVVGCMKGTRWESMATWPTRALRRKAGEC